MRERCSPTHTIGFSARALPQHAVEATVYLGLAQTDLAQLSDAEQTCRAAYSAASALGNREVVLFPAVALARTLLWQKRHADARVDIWKRSSPPATSSSARGTGAWPHGCASPPMRYPMRGGSSSGRARLRRLCRQRSSRLSASARPPSRAAWAISTRCVSTSTHGLAAARAAHLPLQAIKLRLTYVEGLIRAERMGAGARGGAPSRTHSPRCHSAAVEVAHRRCVERAQQHAVGARIRRRAFTRRRVAPLDQRRRRISTG